MADQLKYPSHITAFVESLAENPRGSNSICFASFLHFSRLPQKPLNLTRNMVASNKSFDVIKPFYSLLNESFSVLVLH